MDFFLREQSRHSCAEAISDQKLYSIYWQLNLWNFTLRQCNKRTGHSPFIGGGILKLNLERAGAMQEPGYAHDYFAGGVPPFWMLTSHLSSISELLHVPIAGDDGTVKGLAFIGVVSYAEAFFKDQFAAVLNLFPEKALCLKGRGRDVGIDLTDLLRLEDPLHSKFGFLLSERFNFGSPKAVNSLYHDLLLITPFSKDHVSAFDKVLAIRNLLVHHGGLLTSEFNRDVAQDLRERTFFDSLVISRKQVGEAALLALQVARGTIESTVSRLHAELDGLQHQGLRRKAIDFMNLDVNDETDLISSLNELVTGEAVQEDTEEVVDGDIPF